MHDNGESADEIAFQLQRLYSGVLRKIRELERSRGNVTRYRVSQKDNDDQTEKEYEPQTMCGVLKLKKVPVQRGSMPQIYRTLSDTQVDILDQTGSTRPFQTNITTPCATPHCWTPN
jgi:hypothetical protein